MDLAPYLWRDEWEAPMIRMRSAWWIGLIAAISLLVLLAGGLLAEPLRAFAERELNERSDEYQFRLGRLDLHPFTFSVDWYDVVVRQVEYPEPPVAMIERWHADVQWRALLRGMFVSDHTVSRLTMHIMKSQASEELHSEVTPDEASWQKALLAIYPLKVNDFTIEYGHVIYSETEFGDPIEMTQIRVHASNIRNVESQEDELPSSFTLDAVLFGSGTVHVEGHGDLLREPHVAVKAAIKVNDVELRHLLPVSRPRQIDIMGGVLSVTGNLFYAPERYELFANDLLLRDLKMDIVQSTRPASVARPSARPSGKQVKKAPQPQQSHQDGARAEFRAATPRDSVPRWVLRLARGSVVNSEVGYINRTGNPNYRLFISDLAMHFDHWSNQVTDEMSKVELKGLFMGKGTAEGDAAFRFGSEKPDFAARLKVLRTPLTSINNLLRAHGGVDVARGSFSIFTEMTVKNGRIDGYLKPLLKNVDVYDPVQDRGKGLWNSLLEKLMDVGATVLTNTTRDEVATKAEISGRTDNPQASTWEIVLKLLQNAFFEAILPGLESGKKPEAKLK